MEKVINAGKPFVTPTFGKVKTALILATGAVAISSLALFARCKPASEENVNKAQVQNPVMGDPAQKTVEKVPPKQDAGETHKTEVINATPQRVKTPAKVPTKIKLKGETIDDIAGPGERLPYNGSR